MGFRFADRWQSSLASLFPNRDDKLALLELRDRDLETFLGGLFGPSVPFTPEWAGITEGSGANTGYYYLIAGTLCLYHAEFVYGSGSSITGAATLTLPFESRIAAGAGLHQAKILDSGTQWFECRAYHGGSGGTAVDLEYINTAGAAAVGANISATLPMTWTTNDALYVDGIFPLATRIT